MAHPPEGPGLTAGPFVRPGRLAGSARGHPAAVFFLFSSRLGCLGSLLLSAVLTVVLLRVLDVI